MPGVVAMIAVSIKVLGDFVLDRLLQRPPRPGAGDLFQGDANDRLGCQPQRKRG